LVKYTPPPWYKRALRFITGGRYKAGHDWRAFNVALRADRIDRAVELKRAQNEAIAERQSEWQAEHDKLEAEKEAVADAARKEGKHPQTAVNAFLAGKAAKNQ
jgi:hypothetical protein